MAFFKLPAELRSSIVSLAVPADAVYDLSTMAIPPVMQVCRELRRQAAPLFFERNRFTATVFSDWCRSSPDTHRLSTHKPIAQLGDSSAFGYPHNVAVFRHFTWRIYLCGYPFTGVVATMTMQYDGSSASCSYDMETHLWPLSPADLGTLAAIIHSGAIQRAMFFSRLARFKGWNMADLSNIARTFEGGWNPYYGQEEFGLDWDEALSGSWEDL